MNLKNSLKGLLYAGLFCIPACIICAQTVTISPIPQKVVLGQEIAFANTTDYAAKGLATADTSAVRLLSSRLNLKKGKIKLVIGERGDKAVKKYKHLIPEKPEGYYLKVTPDSVIIAGNDEAGTYYGVQSYLQIAEQPNVMCVTISDYPDVPERGLVEGYYGNPYSQADRLSMFDFMGKQKMNTYIYGPKDDAYHKSKWRENYPQEQADKIKEYVAIANANKVKFIWAIHPGEDIRWNKTDSTNMVNKLKAMYDLGVRAFAVFFDDIGGDGTDPTRQAGLLNYITDEIVNKYEGVAPLILCPTQYNKSWSSGDYLNILGTKSYGSVRIMWTGNSVIDMINESDMDWINKQISRKAYIWLNFPVNDYCVDHLLMGTTYGNDLTIASQLSGFTSNPMEYAEASKVSLYSIADYTWNMRDYEPNSSWKRALKYLMPQHTAAFQLFCENNIDLGTTYHGLRRDGESPRFISARDRFTEALAKGDTAAAVALLNLHFQQLIEASDVLINTDESPRLTTEIEPWCQVMKILAQKGQCVMDMYNALSAANPESFVNSYLRYQTLDEAQTKVRSRDYPGSIKNPNPVVGTTFIVPFLKTSIANLVSSYKKSYNHRLDVFPVQLLENGNYFIKVNGKYLTNEKENVPRSAPTFTANRDNIKPQRQEWFISLDPITERYKIVNAQDNRYLNETGAFSAGEANPYDAGWHTFTLSRSEDGKYSIQNAGNGGNSYWGIALDESRISQSRGRGEKTSHYIFELIPVNEAK